MELTNDDKIEILIGIVAELSNILYNKALNEQEYDKDFSRLADITSGLRRGNLEWKEWEDHIR
mgnify:CR=1 FL=1